MALARESRVTMRTDSSDIELRKGKWTVEEENYANKIISLFNQGMLPVVAGTTLRTYLSDKLRCDPMRITKKYAGASCIGKQVFQLCDNYYECFQENERELQRLETLFLVRINGKGGGLLSKRGSTDAPPVPHQSIYETSNLDPSISSSSAASYHSTVPLPSASKRTYKTSRRGSGSKGVDKDQTQLGLNLAMALGGSPQLVNHRHSHCADPHAPNHSNLTQYDPYRSGSDYEDQSGDDDYNEHSRDGHVSDARPAEGDEGQDDYGYAYDPDCDADSAVGHAQQQQMLRQYQQQQRLPTAGSPAATIQNGFYSSFQAGGRRVLSAPNLTELNLSNWKDTAYRPLPADSLKEMFSLPFGAMTREGGTDTLGYDAHGKQLNASLLPEHVYSVMGNESGRYTTNMKGSGSGRGNKASVHSTSSSNSSSNNSAAAVMAARAKATMLALQRHRQEQQHRPPQRFPLGEGRAVDDALTFRGSTVGGVGVAGSSPKPRMKRSHSAMALVDFEKLAGDDSAAGDLFMQFLNKVSGTSNANTPRLEPKTEQSAETFAANSESNAHLVSCAPGPTAMPEGLIKTELAHSGEKMSIGHTGASFDRPGDLLANQQTADADADAPLAVVLLPSIPPAALLQLPTDADLILPSSSATPSASDSALVSVGAAANIGATLVTATTTEESLSDAMDLS